MLEFLEPLNFLFDPYIDMYYFGCPDNCIVPNSQTHESLNFLVTPIVWIIIGVGVALGILKRLGKLKLRKRKPKEKIRVDDYASRIIQSQKKVQRGDKTRKEKKEYILKDLKINPEEAFEKFVASLDPEHPQTKALQSVPTITKELPIPEQTVIERASLADQEQQVEELMKKENISEDEAVDRIVKKTMKQKPVVTLGGMGIDVSEVDEDLDIFKQDIPPRKYPKQLKKLEKTFKKKTKPKTKFQLNDLGKLRRDQYARQIENKLLKWTFPMPDYHGKDKSFQLDQDQIELGIKRLSLFLSMGEFMADQKRKKKRYWQKVKIVK